MVAEINTGPITEIINRKVENPIFHRFGKKGKDKPLLIKSHADDTTFFANCRPNDLSQKTEDLNYVLNALSSWSSLTLT